MEVYDEAGELLDTSKSIITGTLNTTSANFTWEIDTLGQPGNFLLAVWGTDTNNVWAVGGINIPGYPTTIIHWNGTEWEPFTFPDGGANAIYGFNENDIWVVGEYSNRGFIGHYKDGEWTEYRSDYFYSRGDTVYALWGVWGASPDDVWAVGYNGTIVHWDGENWDKVESGTKEHIVGISGVSATEIYAVTYSNNSSVLLFDGSNWSNIQDEVGIYNTKLVTPLFFKNGNGVVVGRKVVMKKNTVWQEQTEIPSTAAWGFVGGTNSNDIIILGVVSLTSSQIMHYNGDAWERIIINGNTTIPSYTRGVQLFKKKVFIVGENNNHVIIYRGERK